MSKKCLFCGAELEDSATFCDECGRKQEKDAAAEAAPRPEKTRADRASEKEGRAKSPDRFAWASLILGAISLALVFAISFVSIPVAIVGIVLGIKGIKSGNKAISIVGLVMNVVAAGFVLSALIAGMAGL